LASTTPQEGLPNMSAGNIPLPFQALAERDESEFFGQSQTSAATSER
jgi:hypothetical protein